MADKSGGGGEPLSIFAIYSYTAPTWSCLPIQVRGSILLGPPSTRYGNTNPIRCRWKKLIIQSHRAVLFDNSTSGTVYSHNCQIWGFSSPSEYLKHTTDTLKLNVKCVWCSLITSDGSIFLSRKEVSNMCLNMSKKFAFPRFKGHGIICLHNSKPPHFSNTEQ
jgi:hypothetical protein